ncbi:hypothetical protein P7K49_000375, partial [Saguinus oedipus]
SERSDLRPSLIFSLRVVPPRHNHGAPARTSRIVSLWRPTPASAPAWWCPHAQVLRTHSLLNRAVCRPRSSLHLSGRAARLASSGSRGAEGASRLFLRPRAPLASPTCWPAYSCVSCEPFAFCA